MRHNKHMCKAKGLKILQILTYTCTYNTILFSNCFTIVLGIASGFLQRNSKFGSVNLIRYGWLWLNAISTVDRADLDIIPGSKRTEYTRPSLYLDKKGFIVG